MYFYAFYIESTQKKIPRLSLHSIKLQVGCKHGVYFKPCEPQVSAFLSVSFCWASTTCQPFALCNTQIKAKQ